MGKRKPIQPYMEPAELVSHYMRTAQPAPHPTRGVFLTSSMVATVDLTRSGWRYCPICRDVCRSSTISDELRDHLRHGHDLMIKPSYPSGAFEAAAEYQGAEFREKIFKPTPAPTVPAHCDYSAVPDFTAPYWRERWENYGSTAEDRLGEIRSYTEGRYTRWISAWMGENLDRVIRAGVKAQWHHRTGYNTPRHFFIDASIVGMLRALATDHRTVDEFYTVADVWLVSLTGGAP